METKFKNIYSALVAECAKRTIEKINEINEAAELSQLDNWRFTDYLPKSKRFSSFKDVKEAQEYLTKRIESKAAKQNEKDLQHLIEIERAAEFDGMRVSMEWKRSRMWGSNPTAEGADGYGHYTSGSIGGCGYDKGSTAVAKVLNQSLALKKLLYEVKEANIEAVNKDLFGYGSGYGILPYFEGGVGVSCYPRICEKLGLKFETVASGKTFDAYRIDKP